MEEIKATTKKGRKRVLTPEDLTAITEMRNDNKTFKGIGKVYGVSGETVRQYVTDHQATPSSKGNHHSHIAASPLQIAPNSATAPVPAKVKEPYQFHQPFGLNTTSDPQPPYGAGMAE